MKYIKDKIQQYNSSLCKKISLSSLSARDPEVYEFKAPYRCIVVRELIFWRFTDLLSQIVFLLENNHVLGSLILLRCSIETIAILIYLEYKTECLFQGKINFDEFLKYTEKLMLGSKDKSTDLESVNIITILEKSNKKYNKIINIYNKLSEYAHPNFNSVCLGYSTINEKMYETLFYKRINEEFPKKEIEKDYKYCIDTFELAYKEFPQIIEKLEKWILENKINL